MRAIVLFSASALLLGPPSLGGCAERGTFPARSSPTAAANGSTAALSPAPTGVTTSRPPSPTRPGPPVVSDYVAPELEPPAGDEPASAAAPPYGATEAQTSSPAPDDVRVRVESVVGQASTQVERLERMEKTSTDVRREDLNGALTELEERRAKVLADLREFKMQPSGREASIRAELDRDLDDLRTAIRTSYGVVPPPSQGMPPPAPLSPSQLP